MKTFNYGTATIHYNSFCWLSELPQEFNSNCNALTGNFPEQIINGPKILNFYFHFTFHVSGKQ